MTSGPDYTLTASLLGGGNEYRFPIDNSTILLPATITISLLRTISNWKADIDDQLHGDIVSRQYARHWFTAIANCSL